MEADNVRQRTAGIILGREKKMEDSRQKAGKKRTEEFIVGCTAVDNYVVDGDRVWKGDGLAAVV